MLKKLLDEFKAFALRGNVMDMAVGVIVGGAILTPILNFLTGAEMYSLAQVKSFGSSFVSSIVNFIIMAFILFCLLKAVNKLVALGVKKDEEPKAPTTKICPYCKSEISIEATRCPHCTSELN